MDKKEGGKGKAHFLEKRSKGNEGNEVQVPFQWQM